MKQVICSALFLMLSFIQAQVGIGTENPSPKSVLELKSTDKGFLMPRMSTADRTAINPTAVNDKGLQVFDTTTNSIWFWDGTNWIEQIDTNTSELEKVSRTSNPAQWGYILRGRDNNVYGEIGHRAIDFSYVSSANPLPEGVAYGATGYTSFATGNRTTASGNFSFASGANTIASGTTSFAMGNGSKAKGIQSVAMGAGTNALGENSVAMGNSTEATTDAVAMGRFSKASGLGSLAMGDGSESSGKWSTAMGGFTKALGNYSVSTGYGSEAAGEFSFATGRNITANSWVQTTVGGYNTDRTATTNLSSEPVFVVGTGINSDSKNDGLVVYRDGTIELDKRTSAPATTTDRLYVVNNDLHYNGVNLSEHTLQKLTEGTNTGYRISGRNDANYGDIGNNAIDLSVSSSTSTTNGATGTSSFAIGYNTTASLNNAVAMGDGSIASSFNSFAVGARATASGQNAFASGSNVTANTWSQTTLGSYNTDRTPSNTNNFNGNDPAFVVGIGKDASNKNDGLVVYKDGTIELDKLTTSPTTTTNRMYVLNNDLHYNGVNLNGGEHPLQKISKSGNTGYRITGRNAANYGDIGNNAIDFSNSSSASTTKGATGILSFALGYNTTASLNNAVAMGDGSIASGSNTLAVGRDVTSNSWSQTTVGSFNTDKSPNSATAHNNADPAFVVGIGINANNKKDGLVVYKDGTLELDKRTTTPTTTTNRLYVVNNELHYNGVNLTQGATNRALQKSTEGSNNDSRLNSSKYASKTWNNVNIGNKYAVITFTGKHSNQNTDIAFIVNYNVDSNIFYPMTQSQCTVKNLGNGILRVTNEGVDVDLQFTPIAGTQNFNITIQNPSDNWIEGNFSTVGY